ncbi:MAG: anti-sigma factor domain-containing protein [Syntrophothermus sp.]
MRRHLGLVLEKRGNRVIVVTPAGEFRNVTVRGRIPGVGEEIGLPRLQLRWLDGLSVLQKPGMARVAAAALAACLAIGLLVLPSSPFNLAERVAEARTVAYVTVDINPSVEMGIDADQRVLLTRGLNREGRKILAGLSLSGSDVRTATRRLAAEAIRLGYLQRAGQSTVVIAITPKAPPGTKVPLSEKRSTVTVSPEEALKDEVAAEVVAAVGAGLGSRDRYPAVQAMVVSGEVRREARKMGLSSAKYLAFRQAVVAGRQVTAQQFQEEDISTVPAPPGASMDSAKAASRSHPVGDAARARVVVTSERSAQRKPGQLVGQLASAPVPGKNVLYIVNGQEIGYGPEDQEDKDHGKQEKARVKESEKETKKEQKEKAKPEEKSKEKPKEQSKENPAQMINGQPMQKTKEDQKDEEKED